MSQVGRYQRPQLEQFTLTFLLLAACNEEQSPKWMSVSGWWFYVCYFSSQLQFMYLKGEKKMRLMVLHLPWRAAKCKTPSACSINICGLTMSVILGALFRVWLSKALFVPCCRSSATWYTPDL